MAADVSAITYFAPVAAFLIVFLVSFAVLLKSKILGESSNRWVLVFISLSIASLFVAVGSIRQYVETIAPWFAALLLSLFFLLVLLGVSGHKHDKLIPALGIVFMVFAFLIFLVSGVVLFSDSLAPYLPGVSYEGNLFTDWLYSPAVIGAVILIFISSIVAWLIVKK